MVPPDTIEALTRAGATEARLLEAVLDQLPAAVVIAEAPSGKAIALSRRARELLGDHALDELVVRRLDGSVVPPASRPLARAAGSGESVRNELFTAELPGGSQRVVSVNTTPVRDDEGTVIAAVAVFDDVTERTRHLRAEREFVANAAHELRTPLASIISSVEVLQAGAKERPAERDLFLAHIEREAQRLTRLGRALLIIARAQTRSERPRVEIVPLRALLKEVAAGTRPAEQVKVSVRCPATLAALTSRELIEQAVLNLALNAARYTQTGSIALGGRSAGDAAVIEIRDTGPGMTDAERARVFDRFYRAGEPGDGYGLGLSIARQAVEAVDGTLELESAAGRGTTARIRLPLARLVQV
ncbi:MAG TPA: ATP-binding protein [Gaiellaceae bacterium]|nr:ATP-binding protein [Gaiellaceae bacterium]